MEDIKDPRTKMAAVIRELNKILVGKDDIIHTVFCAMLAGGHVLLEDVPGVGKTTLALGISSVLALKYKRVQFTPDVLPSDVTGFMMFNRKTNEFEYKEGAVMTNLLLADEINRTSSKTQSALLEVMEERRTTVDSVTHELPQPFFVLATENPNGSAGTQKLPESQLDRFMVRISIGYPQLSDEVRIYQGQQRSALASVQQVLTADEFVQMQECADRVETSEAICEYLARLVKATRDHEMTELGLSPRGGIAVLQMAKAKAYLDGRDYVIPEDIRDVWEATAYHRILVDKRGKINGIGAKEISEDVFQSVSLPE